MITWTNITDMSPDTPTVAVSIQTLILGLVNDEINVEKFGGEGSSRLELARTYLALHMVYSGHFAAIGVSGPVKKETQGRESTEYSEGFSKSNSVHGSTIWGQKYDELCLSSRALGIMVI